MYRFLLALLLVSPILSHVSADEKAKVLKVIDGDTISARFKFGTEHIRLIGIDAPEMHENPKALRDAQKSGKDLQTIFAQGRSSQKKLEELVPVGSEIGIEYDIERRDRYGRLLAYLFLGDGRMVNDEMVKSGYAALLTVPPNVKYAERLKNSLTEARRKELGLWAANSPNRE